MSLIANPSDQQLDIFSWFRTPDAEHPNLVVEAYAGTGKTTTIVAAIAEAPEKAILLAAFNKRIQKELEARMTNPNARAQTLHAVGFEAIRRYWERIGIASPSWKREAALVDAVCKRSDPDAIKRLVGKLSTKGREMRPLAESPADLLPLAWQFDCVPDEEWARDGFTVETVAERAYAALERAADKPADGRIDFADMLFLPLRNRWLRGAYDLVVIDECQDMTLSQLLIARRVCTPDGRVVLVGDSHQAIYAFRGADSRGLDLLKAELHADTKKLSVTYRCAQSIVALAQTIVPEYEAAPTAPAGEVIDAVGVGAIYDAAKPGDFVLSRKNAPLVGLALGLIKRGTRARIEGRDIGAGLAAIAKKIAKGAAAHSMPKWLEKLAAWKAREIERAEKADQTAKADLILDQYDTLMTLADGLTGVPELLTRLETMFIDAEDGVPVPTVVCSSVHRAKGLEADRVFLLVDTLYPPVACECGHRHFRTGGCKCGCEDYRPEPMAQREEQNIAYVAITRARHTLVRVTGTGR